MRTRILATAALLAAVAVAGVSWPPAIRPASGQPDPELRLRTLAGAFHVHSTQSDGTGTRAEIAGAAARAGLQFVVFTDHGDATRQPDAPSYVNGVLCIDAVEISTNGGHYVALGLPAAPYRLGGEPSAVAEDVRRLGGFGIVAHPDSPRPALAWRDWSVGVDALEWLNADSAWRNTSSPALARTLLQYLSRPGPALAAMLDRSEITIRRWDGVTSDRRMPAFAAHDAHGGLGGAADEAQRFSLRRVPSYESSFRSFAMRALLRTPPRGDAAADAALLLEALRAGRSYTVVDGLAAPGWLEFRGERGSSAAAMGEELPGSGPARLTVRAPTLEGGSIVLLRNGAVVSETRGGEASTTTSGPGAYRVEVRLDDRPSRAPWIFSNPIYVDLPAPAPSTSGEPGVEVASLLHAVWRTETDPSSSAVLATDGDRTTMRFGLRADQGSPFAALVTDLPQPTPSFDEVLLDLVSPAPARISVQFRSAEGSARWRKSVYVSPVSAPTLLRTADLIPAEAGGRQFEPAAAASILLVIDLVNSLPGASGQISIRNLTLLKKR